jgi:diguanylate cyclase (GGDEF)-like protein
VTEQADRRGRDRVVTATVLVVDDSGATRRILRRTLEEAGYRVSEAADGAEALVQCRAERPDLVLLDIDMPGMDGPTALSHMQADDDLVDIPVLFLTARSSGSDVAAGLVSAALTRRSRAQRLHDRAVEADRLSTVDALTGLTNRRGLDRCLAEWRGAGEGLDPIGVVMIDVDHFKHVNDTEGHLVGDAVLRIAARRLRGAIGDPPVAVRWGGEEFLVIGRELDDAAVAELAELIRDTIGSKPFSIDEQRTLAITVSAGCVSGRFDALEELIALADEALYQAKRAGRNRVEAAVSRSSS